MDLNAQDPVMTRALALALMRQSREYLRAAGEDEAGDLLDQSISALLKKTPDPVAAHI